MHLLYLLNVRICLQKEIILNNIQPKYANNYLLGDPAVKLDFLTTFVFSTSFPPMTTQDQGGRTLVFHHR